MRGGEKVSKRGIIRKQREKEKGGSERIERVDSVLPTFPHSHPRSLVVPHIPAPHVSVAQVDWAGPERADISTHSPGLGPFFTNNQLWAPTPPAAHLNGPLKSLPTPPG